MIRYLVPSLVLGLFGCQANPLEFGDDKGPTGGVDTGNPDDTGDSDTDSDSDTDTDTDSDTDTDTDTDPEYGFDVPGDWVELSADSSPSSLRLADESGDQNQDQQFFVVLINNDANAQGYGFRYTLDAAPGPAAPMAKPKATFRAASHPRASGAHPAPRAVHHRDALSLDDIGTTIDTFRVRSDITDTSEYTVKDATLWALGDHVAIWVDNEVPIDWDKECDGVIDVEHPYDTFGFDNCDLSLVADITDLNIVPNVTSMFGDVSDIDGDSRIDVFISPELNYLPITSTDEVDQLRVLPSYAEPAVDLEEYDIKSNPGSDQREVIYAYAPDPNGSYNYNAPVSIDNYVSYALSAEIARSLVSLVSYNQHILVAEGSTIESDWMNDVMGTLAADRCGFGSGFHHDAWLYLDSTHLQPLQGADTRGSLDSQARGAQYTFGVWLWDFIQETATDPDAFWLSVMATDKTGADAIEYAIEASGSGTPSFEDLVLNWQLSLVTSGVLLSDGTSMELDDVTAFDAPEFISSPPALRDNLYGANGYQRGLSLRGINYAYTGGHTDAPAVQASSNVLLENADYYHFHPAFNFEGYLEGGYASQVVRLDGIPYDAAALELQFTGAGFIAAGIRWNDPVVADYAIENIFSSTAVDAVALPSIEDAGGMVTGIGEIRDPAYVSVIDADGDVTSLPVEDTDRWALDLSGYPAVPMEVHIWLDRRLNTAGDTPLDNPWVAVVPAAWVPEPTSEGTSTPDSCPSAETFEFPTSTLDYLYGQVFLSATMGDDDSEFDACGTVSAEALECHDDFDLDGVADENEPAPANFVQQVLVQRCTSFGGVLPDNDKPNLDDGLDFDELDEDDFFTYDPMANSGGVAGVEGEEGFVAVNLYGGQEYLIVVGSGDVGLYELSVRIVE